VPIERSGDDETEEGDEDDEGDEMEAAAAQPAAQPAAATALNGSQRLSTAAATALNGSQRLSTAAATAPEASRNAHEQHQEDYQRGKGLDAADAADAPTIAMTLASLTRGGTAEGAGLERAAYFEEEI
jgi:hypothetical protein